MSPRYGNYNVRDDDPEGSIVTHVRYSPAQTNLNLVAVIMKPGIRRIPQEREYRRDSGRIDCASLCSQK